MGNRFDKPYVFKPARRVFAGRGRSMMTFGEWKIAFYAMLFGGAVSMSWMQNAQNDQALATLAAPPANEAAQAAAAAPVPAAPNSAAPVLEAAFAPAADEFAASYFIARAAGVYDGGTIRLDGVSARIRVWGADAPAREGLGPVEARRALAALVSGRTLACEQTDRLGEAELAADCVMEDGTALSAAMLIAAAPDYSSEFDGYADSD